MPQGGFRGLFDPRGRLRREDLRPSAAGRVELFRETLWLEVDVGAGPGKQRIASSEDVCVGVAGDLFNASELCRALSLPEESDTGVLLLRCIAAWPKDWMRRVDGQFAIAVWHRVAARIDLACDISGAYSVYYARDDAGRLAFSTRLQDLFGLTSVQPRLARSSLHEYLRFLDIATPNTIYEGVLALPSGSLLSCTEDGVRVEASPPCEAEPPARDFDAAVERLNELMYGSIERRLRGSSRAAAFLSGGVDSALICAIAGRIAPGIETVTVGFGREHTDMSPVAARIAHSLGLGNRILRFDRESTLAAFESFSRDAEQPTADPASAPTLLAFRDCRQRFETVLDGTGADALAGVMPPRHVRIAVEYASLLPKAVRRTTKAALSRVPMLAGYAPIFDFEHPAEMLIRWRGFGLKDLPALCGDEVDLEHTHFFRTFSGFPRGEHYKRYAALLAALPDDRLHQASRMTGLGVRYPFVERNVAGYVRQLPLEYLYAPDEPKRIIKSVLSRYVPRPLWDFPKQGFDFPLLEFLTAEDCLVARRHLDRERWQDRGLLDTKTIAALADRFTSGERGLAFKVLALVVLDLWLDSHGHVH